MVTNTIEVNLQNVKIKSLKDKNEILVVKGSESFLYLTHYLAKETIIKVRQPKKYRHATIDDEIVLSRMRFEARIIKILKSLKINVPTLYAVDQANNTIYLEYLKGKMLTDYLDNNSYFFNLGKIIARLHISHILHSDINPQNVIISNNEIYLIDFGLAYISDEIKDKVMDLFILKGSLKHFEVEKSFDIVMQGYAEVVDKHEFSKIKNQLDALSMKGRYKKVIPENNKQ